MPETPHLAPNQASAITPWVPTASEVAVIVEEMRPIILAFAERSRQELQAPHAA